MSEASAVDTTTASRAGLTGPGERHLLDEVLSVARRHLRMEVAFIASVSDGRRTFEYADMVGEFAPFAVGDSDPLEDTYCGRVLTGLAPELMLDARNEPSVADLAATAELPVGTHLSVPVCTAAGVYGTLCCFSRGVVAEVSPSDLDLLRLLADIVGKHLEPMVDRAREEADERELLSDLLDAGGPTMVVQPIVDLDSGDVWCYEALARFPARDGWGPPDWFSAAHRVGLGTALESAAVHNALALLPRLPEEVCLSVNASACALLGSASIVAMLTGDVARRLVVEVTEHERIADLQQVNAVLTRARAAGVRVAVDDAGSGFAGLEHILNLAPEVLKLDRTLVDGIASDPARQAMCEAMIGFCRRTGAVLVAEGLETAEDLEMLRRLGVTHAQGYLLGRPGPLPEDPRGSGDDATAGRSLRTDLPSSPARRGWS